MQLSANIDKKVTIIEDNYFSMWDRQKNLVIMLNDEFLEIDLLYYIVYQSDSVKVRRFKNDGLNYIAILF